MSPKPGTPTGGQCSRGSPQAAGTSLADQRRLATTRLTVFRWWRMALSGIIRSPGLLAVGQERLRQARRCGAADALGVLGVPFGSVPLQEEDSVARANTRSGPQLATDVGAGELLHRGAGRECGKNRLGRASRGGRLRRRR